MKRFYFINVNTKRVLFITYGFLILFALIIFNVIYFSVINSPISVFAPENSEKAKLAIIIDDFGESRQGVKEMMEIKKPLTFAIMPFLSHSTEDAEEAFKNNHEVIVHLSMEPQKGKASWLGPRPIMSVTPNDVVTSIVIDAFADVPHAVGANIHMGSKASESEEIMNAVLNVIAANKGYFVDSKTSAKRIPAKISREKGIPCFENNLFLDSTQSKAKIKSQLKKAAECAVKNKTAIAIGHVGPDGGVVTASAIVESLPLFEEKGIELVYVSDLLDK